MHHCFFTRRAIPAGILLSLASALFAQSRDTTTAIVSGSIGVRADSVLRTLTDSGFSGVVLVAKNGDVVLEKGYGLANRAAKTPFSATSVVQIGSNTKDFTIVAILQLMEQGKLALSDSLAKFFPRVPDDKRAITIDDLLNHRAGFDQHLGPDFDVVTRDEEVSRAFASTLLFKPGSDRKYSNIGFSLLAAIIELTSGAAYDQYVRDHILTPLGLHDTGLLLPGFDRRRVAHGYRGAEDMGTFLERPLAADGPYWNLRGTGGMLSTVSDMYRFYRALMSDGPLLRPASRDLFFHPERPAILAGSDLTFFFFYSRNPVAGLDAILVSNSTDYPAPQARERLATALGVGQPGGRAAGAGRGQEISVDTTGSPGRGRGTIGGSQRDAAGVDASVAMPDTPACRAARQFMQLYARADDAAVQRFIEQSVKPRTDDRRTLAERVAAFGAMRKNLGFVTPTRIVSQSPLEITFEARSVMEGMLTFTITVEGAPPNRITGIQVETR